MPARGVKNIITGLSANELLAIAKDPEEFEKRMAALAERTVAAETAEQIANEATKAAEDATAKLEKDIDAFEAYRSAEQTKLSNGWSELTTAREAQTDRLTTWQTGLADRETAVTQRENTCGEREVATKDAQSIAASTLAVAERDAKAAADARASAEQLKAEAQSSLARVKSLFKELSI